MQDNLSFPLICPNWNVDEEILLLEGIEMYGFGNWTEVIEYVGTKSKSQCIDHCNAIYMNSPCFPLPDLYHVMGKSREELLAMVKRNGQVKKEIGSHIDSSSGDTFLCADKNTSNIAQSKDGIKGEGIMFQDITTLLLDPKAFKDIVDLFVERYKGKNISVAGKKNVFLFQKVALYKCNMAGKPAVVTCVVNSMTDNLRPTRAKATDVANAVLDDIEQFPWKEIEFLDISSNVILGDLPIPPLTTIEVLISNNSLSGDISSLIWNEGLLGFPLSRDCSKNEPPQPSHSNLLDKDGSKSIIAFGWKCRLSNVLPMVKVAELFMSSSMILVSNFPTQ
ncbi:hypothetical protein CRYUN_Cryun38cG0005700 [Craigia yunnanensis]